MTHVHHSAICTGDVDASLRFWRDGLGFRLLMDQRFEGDWPALFNAPSSSLRSIFLGDPDEGAGVVELVDLGPDLGAIDPPDEPVLGFFLLSVFTDLDTALTRLRDLGLGGPPRRVTVSGVDMAVVRDPSGVLVELIDTVGRANFESLADPAG